MCADAQADLDLAMPALLEAIRALDSLSKKDIAEVKAMSSPPPGARCCAAVFVLLLLLGCGRTV